MGLVSFLFARRTTAACLEDLAAIHAPGQTRMILQRERSRADRSGTPLAVISFALRRSGDANDCLPLLVRMCKKRFRVTDEIGWLNKRRVCAILPCTDAAGAWKVADDICRSFPDDIMPPLCTVHTFSSSPTNGSGHSRNNIVAKGTCGDESLDGASAHLIRPVEELFVQPVPLWKRTMDLAGVSIGLPLSFPVFVLVALAVRLTSKGPIFFRQWRSGRGGKPFVMYKFRTMVADAEQQKNRLLHLNERDGPAFKIKSDPRITTVGRFLRATSLDELPQLWNVLRGEMSLVGPRPLPCDETAAAHRWQRRRLDVNPGLTCIWQVKGRAGVLFPDWIRMDMQYIRSMSLAQDLKLLVLTIPAVLRRGGAH
jgi:lipopolysaccharide/colanic/teichoic acid biosynthesis glycosyltransferase